MLPKTMIAFAATTVLAAASAAPATAAQYCAVYAGAGGNCGFQTLAQCNVTVSGAGGSCNRLADRRQGFIAQRPVPAAAFGAFATPRFPARVFARDPAEQARLDRARGSIW